MPYTLVKFLLWFGLAAVVGVAIGWALRSLRARAELSALRGTTIDAEELGRLRGQRDNLDEVLAERDRLRALVAELQRSQPGTVNDAVAAVSAVEPTVDVVVADESVDAPIEHTPGADDTGIQHDTGAVAEDGETRPLDAAAAAGVIGRAIEIDDLTVVEGIGPKIAELCRGIGVTTWHDLANTSVDDLRSMLHDAGSRYRVHRPDTWPEQASLLARGAWSEFVAFTDELDQRS